MRKWLAVSLLLLLPGMVWGYTPYTDPVNLAH